MSEDLYSYLPFFIVALYILIVMPNSWLVWRFKEKKYINVWKRFAGKYKLRMSPGSFFPKAPVKPNINGKFKKREINISSFAVHSLFKREMVMKISVVVKNKPKDDLPKGGFFVVGDPRKESKIPFVKIQSIEISSAEAAKFPYKAVPENLGTYLMRQESLLNLMKLNPVNDILLNENSLDYRQVGLFESDQEMEYALNELMRLAESFEQFSRAWL